MPKVHPQLALQISFVLTACALPIWAGEVGVAVSATKASSSSVSPRASIEYTGHANGNATADEQYLLELVNRARKDPAGEAARYGTPNDKSAAPPLAMNGILTGAARAHSKDMEDRNFFDHTNPDGQDPFDRMTAAGYTWSAAGENIAGGQADVEAAHKAWLGSSGHRANIYSTNFREIGPGVYFGSGKLYTQKFGRQGGGGPTKFVLGVVYDDKNGNSFYDPGEGLSGVRIEFTSGSDTHFTTTSTVGGYAIPYPTDETLQVTASGGALSSSQSKSVTTSGSNVKVDFTGSGGGSGSGAPAITSALSASGTVNVNFSYTITASGSATISFSTSSLPPGLILSGDKIQGTPSTNGSFTVTITATNGIGSDTKSLTITVAAAGGGSETFTSNSTIDSDSDGVADEIEDAMGTSSSNASDTPMGISSSGTTEVLDLLKIKVKLNFASSDRDMVMVTGTLPIPADFVVNGQQVAVDVGGVVKTFTLDEKGRSPKADDLFRIKVKSRKGKVEAQVSKFNAKFKKGNVGDKFTDEGLVSDRDLRKQAREVPVIILFNNTVYSLTRSVLYTAKAGKKGSAK